VSITDGFIPETKTNILKLAGRENETSGELQVGEEFYLQAYNAV
jgi:hypothetical protein